MAARGKKAGRPAAIDDDHLFNQCDGLITLLDQDWGDLGWELETARSVIQLRAAFGAITVPPYLQRLRAPFTRTTSATSSAGSLRQARRTLKRANELEYRLSERIIPVANRLRETAELLTRGVSGENVQAITEEHRDRLMAYGVLRAEIDDLEVEQLALRSRLLDEEAAYAQQELLAFIGSGKYEHNPRNIACAMAGLPDIGCNQSFRRCARRTSHLWPSSSYAAFEIIARCSQSRDSGDVLGELRRTIQTMRPRDRVRADAKRLLSANWRFVRKAVETAVTDATVSARIPYKIFSALMKAQYQSRSGEEGVLADRERLDRLPTT